MRTRQKMLPPRRTGAPRRAPALGRPLVPSLGLVVVALLGGCAHSLRVAVDALAPGAAEPRRVAVGQVLRSGEQLSLRVESDQPGSVALLRVPHSGGRQVLQGELPIRPGAPLRLPPGGGAFQLDSEVGAETLVIVASPGSLPDALLQTIDLGLAQGAQRETTARDDPPPTIGDKQRGLDSAAAGSEVRVPLRRRGVTLLRFTFQHR